MNWAGNVIRSKIRMLGRNVTVCGQDGKIETRGIIAPVDSVSEAARTAVPLPDGYYPPGSYQYFGLPEVSLGDAETVMDGDDCYLIRRKELYQLGEEPLYWWALMIRGGVESE